MEVVRKVGMGIIGLAFLVIVVGQVVGVAADVSGGGGDTTTESFSESLSPSSDAVELSGTNISSVTVRQTLNNSARLDGSGSITGDVGSVAATHTVSTWVSVNNSTGVRQVISIDSRTLIVYNGGADEWACWHYDASAGETYRVAVAAPTAGQWTNIQCERSSNRLTVRRNATAAETSVITDAGNATTQTLTTVGLDGRLDETRVFNGSLSPSEQQALYSDPTAPLDSAPRQSRVLFDTSLDSIPVYFSSGSLDGSAATRADGLRSPPAPEGTEWSRSGTTISLLAGLAGAPVVFVDWAVTSGSGIVALKTLIAQYGAIFGLLILIPLIIAGQSLFGDSF